MNMEKYSMIHSDLEKGVSVTKGFPGKADWFLLRLLESAVYWMSIAYIPKGLLHKRRKNWFSFSWTMNPTEEIPFVKCYKLAKPK